MFRLQIEEPCNYQNGNTLKAMTLNQRRWKDIAISEDFYSLRNYAKHMNTNMPLRIVDRALRTNWNLVN